jgi:hypothetical protein
MPASGKMLKKREQAKNRAAGIGDEMGRLPSQIKKPEVMIKCSQCGQEIRATKTNTEAKQHWESRHGSTCSSFALCFPGAFDPTAPPPAAGASSSSGTVDSATEELSGLTVDEAAAAVPEKPKKKKEDLSFLDAALVPTKAKK